MFDTVPSILQSPIASIIPLATSVNVKLTDFNYTTWLFLMEVMLEGHGIIGFVDGSTPCPPRFSSGSAVDGLNHVETDDYQVWKMHDSALMQLIYTTLSSSAMSCVLGTTSAQEMWVRLKDRFSTVTRSQIFQMKIDLYNIKKGSETMAAYLHRIQEARDLLYAVGVSVDDEDIVILALNGLPAAYNTFRCVIQCRASVISFRDFRALLLAEETTIAQPAAHVAFSHVMVANTSSLKHKGSIFSAAPVAKFPIWPVPSIDVSAEKEASVSQIPDTQNSDANVVMPQCCVSSPAGHAYDAPFDESSFLESATSVFSSDNFLIVPHNTGFSPPKHIFGLDESFLALPLAPLPSTSTLSAFNIDSAATLCAPKDFGVPANGDDTNKSVPHKVFAENLILNLKSANSLFDRSFIFGKVAFHIVSNTHHSMLDSELDYNDMVQLVVPSTIVCFLLALAGHFQWKIKHMAQPPGFAATLYHLVCTFWFSACRLLLAAIISIAAFFTVPNPFAYAVCHSDMITPSAEHCFVVATNSVLQYSPMPWTLRLLPAISSFVTFVLGFLPRQNTLQRFFSQEHSILLPTSCLASPIMSLRGDVRVKLRLVSN